MIRQQHLLIVTALAAVVGCQQEKPQQPAMGPPAVEVSKAVLRDVIDYEEFTGRTEAFETVEVRARVSGHLDKVLFTDGALVKKGDVLFQIDPQPLQAELERTEANVAQAEAHHNRLETDQKRASRLVGTSALGREEFDKITADRAEAYSALQSARAARNLAKLNLDYSRVVAPISGKIGRRMIDPGNMVKAEETALTYLANLDPMYAYFDVDERNYLRISRLLAARGITTLEQLKKIEVEMGLADDEGFPRKGKLNFVDNHLDSNSGSVWVRGLFPNPDQLLAPGLFVRVRLP